MNILQLSRDLPSAPNVRDTAQTKVSQDAWQREMERAETQSWLSHPVIKGGEGMSLAQHLTKPSGTSGILKNFAQNAKPASAFMIDRSLKGVSGTDHSLQGRAAGQPYPSDKTLAGNPSATNAIQREEVLPSARFAGAMPDAVTMEMLVQDLDQFLASYDPTQSGSAEDVPANDPGRLHGIEQDTANPPALSNDPGSDDSRKPRLHAEWSAHGLRLWLGVDKENEAAIPHLVGYLIGHLQGKGVTLVSLVCNGQALYTSSTNEQPTVAEDISSARALNADAVFNPYVHLCFNHHQREKS